MEGSKSFNQFSVAFTIFACVCFSACASLFGRADADPKPKPEPSRNEQLTSEAWKAFEKKDFREAIAKADKCIESFKVNAVKQQKQLEKAGVKVPNGEVTEEEKKAIHQNGLLNDVATCYFIKGKAFEELKEKKSAIAAYKDASKLTHARAWDPTGKWFWSPAEAADERLEKLK